MACWKLKSVTQLEERVISFTHLREPVLVEVGICVIPLRASRKAIMSDSYLHV